MRLMSSKARRCSEVGVAREAKVADGAAVDLTRFSGHITVTQRGVQNVEERQQIYAGVSVPDGTAGTVRARYEGANQGVWGFYLVDTSCTRSEEHTSELQSLTNLVCRLLLE